MKIITIYFVVVIIILIIAASFEFETGFKCIAKNRKSYKNHKTMSQILVKYGVRRALAKQLRVSEPTVRKALLGKSSGELTNRIRKTAIEMGGVEYNNK